MLRSVKELNGYTVAATDGDIGEVKDVYFNDEHWAIRYLIVDTAGFWQEAHQVLIYPMAFRNVEWATQRFHLALTVEKVKNSPRAELDLPVSRQFEQTYFQYYDWPFYWGQDDLAGSWSTPGSLSQGAWVGLREDQPKGDHHLRSAQEVIGYHIEGTDEGIGHVQDLIVDDQTWEIRYLVVDTNTWWAGKSVLLAPHWIDRISWEENTVFLSLPRATIKNAPEWKPGDPINREYELRLYDFYGRPAYWLDGQKAAGHSLAAKLSAKE